MIQKGIIVFGIILIVLGTIFHFQGKAVVGPESSFMYSNPEWITYGIQVVISGIIITILGIIIKVIKRS